MLHKTASYSIESVPIYFRDLAERAPERFAALGTAMGEEVDALPESQRAFR